ncbi:hypothetical protein [Bradyrhizobium sp. LB11.1]|uniref:hypothetical protein n=1 Tax=Bradyrhizobium sp. LB11.1 TaxID=3156326 RepID=UPI003393038A
MRKSRVCDLLARRLGLRENRITSLAQRLAEAGLLPTASGPPYPDLSPVEVARMLIVGVTDEGLGAAPKTTTKYGGLIGPSATLEEVLAHALSRPESIAPCRSSLEIHQSDEPYAVLTTAQPDGPRTLVFGKLADTETVDRLVTVPGSALFAIASEINGVSAADVDALLEGVGQQQSSEAA